MNDPGTHKLTEALDGRQSPPDASQPPEGGPPQPTAAEVAEETRREQQSRPDGEPDRDRRLTQLGRGDQTHG